MALGSHRCQRSRQEPRRGRDQLGKEREERLKHRALRVTLVRGQRQKSQWRSSRKASWDRKSGKAGGVWKEAKCCWSPPR